MTRQGYLSLMTFLYFKRASKACNKIFKFTHLWYTHTRYMETWKMSKYLQYFMAGLLG